MNMTFLQSSSINAAEFHQFLVTDDKDLGWKRGRLKWALTVVYRVSTDLEYLLGLCFFYTMHLSFAVDIR